MQAESAVADESKDLLSSQSLPFTPIVEGHSLHTLLHSVAAHLLISQCLPHSLQKHPGCTPILPKLELRASFASLLSYVRLLPKHFSRSLFHEAV